MLEPDFVRLDEWFSGVGVSKTCVKELLGGGRRTRFVIAVVGRSRRTGARARAASRAGVVVARLTVGAWNRRVPAGLVNNGAAGSAHGDRGCWS